MDGLPLDRWTRALRALCTRRALTTLIGGVLTAPLLTQDEAEARRKRRASRKKRKQRRPAGKINTCKRRCRKKANTKARRRCLRGCKRDRDGQSCRKNRDCGPCERCQGKRCVATCQPGQTCRNGRCRTVGPDTCLAEGTEMVVTSYAQVANAYAQGSAGAREVGPEAVANFVQGRFAELQAQFLPELQPLVPPDLLEEFSYVLQHNRVHFEAPDVFASFDGYLAGDTISGYFTQGFDFSFAIQATTPLEPGSIVGQWEGFTFDPVGTIFPDPFAIVVTFVEESGELTGTLEVVGVFADIFPLANISINATRPLNTEPPEIERAFPGPDWSLHTALVEWGDAHVAISVYVDLQDQLLGINIVPDWPLPPDPVAGVPVQTVIRLPFNGVWLIASGGPRLFQNHHALSPDQRYAYDFGVWNVNGTTLPNPAVNEDFWAWEQPLFAPAAGTVILAANDVPDNTPFVPNTSSIGNAIQLETAPGEYLLMAHLKHGSVVVTEGEQVQEGQYLARIGNSGFSNGPHLHMQLQNADGYSLPINFKDLLVNGKPVSNPTPVSGDFVQHAACPTPVPAEYALLVERDRPSRASRRGGERPLMTRRSAEWLRSPAAVPIDGLPALPWGKR